MQNRLNYIKRTIYRLKRSYGLPLDYVRMTPNPMDITTGEKDIIYTKTYFRKAVVLRAREFRSFVYDLAYISANKDFTTGGFFDPEDRRIILDAADLPVGFDPNVDDFIIFQNEKYEVKEVSHFENNYAYVLLVRKLRGAPLVRVDDYLSVLNFQQTAACVIVDRLTIDVTSELAFTQELNEVV